MTTPVPTGQPGFGYGLGLIVIDTPTGRLLGHDGAIPGFLNIVLSTEDGRRQERNEQVSDETVRLCVVSQPARDRKQPCAELPADREDRARLDDDLEDLRLLAGIAQQRARDDQVPG